MNSFDCWLCHFRGYKKFIIVILKKSHSFSKVEGMNSFIDKIKYEPRSGEDMERATLHKVPIYKYSDLCTLAKKNGPATMLAHMFKRSDDNIILLQDPVKMNSGHWISVSRNLPKKEIYFFSTYGGKPDAEKVEWMSDDELHESGQLMNIFNEGLHAMQGHGWEIHYNDYPYQKPDDDTATCGIYTAAFLRSGKNPDEFKAETERIRKSGRDPAVEYYRRYFS